MNSMTNNKLCKLFINIEHLKTTQHLSTAIIVRCLINETSSRQSLGAYLICRIARVCPSILYIWYIIHIHDETNVNILRNYFAHLPPINI